MFLQNRDKSQDLRRIESQQEKVEKEKRIT